MPRRVKMTLSVIEWKDKEKSWLATAQIYFQVSFICVQLLFIFFFSLPQRCKQIVGGLWWYLAIFMLTIVWFLQVRQGLVKNLNGPHIGLIVFRQRSSWMSTMGNTMAPDITTSW